MATFVFGTCGPAAAQEIQACITKSTGNIRIVSTEGQCKSNEASISWNVIGPAGPAGPPGAAGQPGPAGLVAAHQAEASGGNFPGTSLNSFVVGDLLTSLNLPAGNWAIFGRVQINQESSFQYVATCSLRLATAALTKDTIDTSEVIPAGGGFNQKLISMMALVELQAGDTVELRCNDSTTQPARWQDARIIAVQVTTIN